MNENAVAILEEVGLAQLEKLRDTYDARQDRQGAAVVRAAIERRGAVQTEELSRCGRLFPHKVQLDPSGLGMRPAIAYTGDPAAWLAPFLLPGASGRMNVELFTGANSPGAKALARQTVTVALKPGERVQVVRD